jgi:hypothetical protein
VIRKMKRIVCSFLAAWLAVFPFFAEAAASSPPEMVDYRSLSKAKSETPKLSDRFISKNGHYQDAYFDSMGRLALLQSKNGNEYRLIYDSLFAKSAARLLINGKEASLPLKPSAAIHAKGGPYEQDDDFWNNVEQYRSFLDLYGDCYGCVGIMDDVGDFVGTILAGGGVGSLVGAVAAVLEGAEAAAILFSMGLGALGGFVFTVSLMSGYFIGTFIYDYATNRWYRG